MLINQLTIVKLTIDVKYCKCGVTGVSENFLNQVRACQPQALIS